MDPQFEEIEQRVLSDTSEAFRCERMLHLFLYEIIEHNTAKYKGELLGLEIISHSLFISSIMAVQRSLQGDNRDRVTLCLLLSAAKRQFRGDCVQDFAASLKSIRDADTARCIHSLRNASLAHRLIDTETKRLCIHSQDALTLLMNMATFVEDLHFHVLSEHINAHRGYDDFHDIASKAWLLLLANFTQLDYVQN